MTGVTKRVAVLGATGYSGIELLRLLYSHSGVAVVAVSADRHAGETVGRAIPPLAGLYDLTCQRIDQLYDHDFDVVFLALPHEQSTSVCHRFLRPGAVVIDLSGAFRIKDPAVFKRWYGFEMERALTDVAVYGMPELKRDAIRRARLIANPGCYPTGATIPVAPFLKRRVIANTGIVIDAKSGVTGAGRSPSQELHFSELNEGLRAYKPAEHRHVPEIEQELSGFSSGTRVTFVPHLVPINRGVFTTIYAAVQDRNMDQSGLEAVLTEAYHDEPFVRVVRYPGLPNVNAVRGSNYIDIAVRYDEQNSTAIIFSAIDNLVKGASGQAIQNMNIALGFEEKQGLVFPPVFP
ncbi:MAG: N-acetyl-gamma-glutamyl-phosphate reductase [Deltaproteobacteria bacterium]|nr:N-acetyl-gamma-glutamyl-phosphate reductase [Deltaproteobacteria bacterium]MCL5277486.1 N-acetyl-gamma-glutamyl-phosphate reductase [Deltaproteobacteria bacterium]